MRACLCVCCGLPAHFFVLTGPTFHKFSECENVHVETLRSASVARTPKCVSSSCKSNWYVRTDREHNEICFYVPPSAFLFNQTSLFAEHSTFESGYERGDALAGVLACPWQTWAVFTGAVYFTSPNGRDLLTTSPFVWFMVLFPRAATTVPLPRARRICGGDERAQKEVQWNKNSCLKSLIALTRWCFIVHSQGASAPTV